MIKPNPPSQAGSPGKHYPGVHPNVSASTSGEGDPSNSPGNLLQCSVALLVKKFLLLFRQNLLCCHVCLLPLTLLLGTSEKNLAPYF